jgi:hypothetical protein
MYTKEIIKCKILKNKKEPTKLLCNMEYHLPSSIWGIQFHLIQHLVNEVELCGPISSIWMYFAEWYIKKLKSFLRD